MNIAVIPFPGMTFEQVFSQWSSFFKKEICESSGYMLKTELEKRQIKLISTEELDAGKSCVAVLHFSPFQFGALKKYPDIRHVYIATEPPVVIPMHSAFGNKLLARYVFDSVVVTNHQAEAPNIYHYIPPKGFPRKLQDTDAVPWNQKKLACMFAANKFAVSRNELYTERRKIIKCFEKNCPENFDLYGAEWPNILSVYKGYAKDKFRTSQKYRFSIYLSNVTHVKGCLDEKLFDAMFAGTVPVYQGVDEITEYVPAECFIDYRQFSSPVECLHFLQEMTCKEYEQYRKNIVRFISSEETKKRFSAVGMASAIEAAACAPKKYSERKLWILKLLLLYDKMYHKLCALNRKIEMRKMMEIDA